MHKTWKTGLAVLMTGAVAWGLAGCGGTEPASGGNSGASGNDPVELTFWTLGTNGYEKLAEEYKSVKPNVTVKIQNTGDQTVHHNNMLTALSAGKGAPDIFMLEIAFLEKFMEAKDKFYNLNDLGAKDLKGLYLDWKWKQAESADGKFQLGLPTDIGPTVAYYRTDLMEKAGLPTDPAALAKEIATWDQFAAVAKTFTQKTGKPFVDLTDLLYNALRDQGNEIYYDKDEKFIGDSNPQVRKAYDFTVKGIQEGWIGKTALWSPEWGQETNNGGFGLMLAPAWMNGVIKGNAKDATGKWQITQLPEGSGNWGGSFIALPKESKKQKEAFEFIKWLTGKESQLKSFQTNGLMPSIPSVFEQAEFKDFKDPFFGNQATAVQFAEAAKKVKPIKYGKLHDPTDALFKDALKNVQQKGTDPQKEWSDAVAKAKELNKRS